MTQPPSEKQRCVLTIRGKKYDVTSWLPHHPGGDYVLRKFDGLDATAVFDTFHSKAAHSKLAGFRPIDGDNNSSSTIPSSTSIDGAHVDRRTDAQRQRDAYLERKFEELREQIQSEGLMKTSALYYIFKTASTTALGALAIWLLVATGGSWWFVSAVILGLFWQQSGWLSHEYCHHQVFENRYINDLISYVTGGIYQGFSPVWWKDRHNSHHAATNILDSDPDIDNLPLFVWTTHDFPRVESYSTPAPGNPSSSSSSPSSSPSSSDNEDEKDKNSNQAASSSSPYAYMEYQAYYFLIFCTTLRLIWAVQSLRYVWLLRSPQTSTSKNYSSRYGVEISMLITHWILFALIVAFLVPGILPKILFTIISQAIGGFCIAIIVFFNHYACEHFPHSERGNLTFVELQLRTTRNGTPSFFLDWFAGGLNYQIEHHLFPTMPRHNLLRASQLIKKFCNETGLPYQCCDFFHGVFLIHKQLAEVAAEIKVRNKKFL